MRGWTFRNGEGTITEELSCSEKLKVQSRVVRKLSVRHMERQSVCGGYI